MSKINYIIIILAFLLFPFSSEECIQFENHCTECDSTTKLCSKCESSIYKPDKMGGCEPSKTCVIGQNSCIECDSYNELCSVCKTGLYPDQNGGCSVTDNCFISNNGECLKCIEDYFLIEGYQMYFCKYKYEEDIKNCEEVNKYNGSCNKCLKGFFMNSSDHKCISTKNCKESMFSICTSCQQGFFLDKRDDSCKEWTNLVNCKISMDGKTCDECLEGFYFSKNGRCAETNFCDISGKNSNCQKCLDNYYLSKRNNVCTNQKECIIGNKENGLCLQCSENYFLDLNKKKCLLIQDESNFKYCENVKDNECIKCLNGYELGVDSSCTSTLNCLEAKNGICIKCIDNYHLGLDNKCNNIEHCIYFYAGVCLECEDGFYYNLREDKCYLETDEYKNCKRANFYGCYECKNGYYLNTTNNKCYSNEKEGYLYKCSIMLKNEEKCKKCEENYYLGTKDLKCTKIDGCAVSENENKCIECDEDFCLDENKGKCFDNYFAPEEKERKIYFGCNVTNSEGNECALCKDDYLELKDGICVNKIECAEEKDGECIRCNEESERLFNMCLNSLYGCVDTYATNCLRCDNIMNFDECSECKEGFELNSNNECVEI